VLDVATVLRVVSGLGKKEKRHGAKNPVPLFLRYQWLVVVGRLPSADRSQ
jgi:hypothetical protein